MQLLGLIIGLCIAATMVIWPALGIGDKYGSSEGWGFFVIAACVLGASHTLSEILDHLKAQSVTQNNDRRLLREHRDRELASWEEIESRLSQIEAELSCIQENTTRETPDVEDDYL